MQRGNAGFPSWLIAAVLASQLVDAPVQWLAQAEVVGRKGFHLHGVHAAKQPIWQGHFHGHHAIASVSLDDLGGIDQPEEPAFAFAGRLDVGFDACASESCQHLSHANIGAATGIAIGRVQES